MAAHKALLGLGLLHKVPQELQMVPRPGWDAHKPLRQMVAHRGLQVLGRHKNHQVAAHLHTGLRNSNRPAGRLGLALLIRGNPARTGNRPWR